MLIDHRGRRIPTVTPNSIRGFFVEYRFLSNFHLQSKPIRMWGLWFPTVENAYQAAKTDSMEVKKKFTECSPNKAKSLGQEVGLVDKWELLKVPYMQMFVLQKYRAKEERQMLLDTGSKKLYETNNWGDTFWGETQAGHGTNMMGIVSEIARDYYNRKELK